MSNSVTRADAIDNRERILTAARAALAVPETQPDTINLRSIAQAAGVGQGTLYRHFPSRHELIAAVYRDEMTMLVDAAADLLKIHEPLDALRTWFGRVIEYARIKRGVIAAVETSVWQHFYATEHPRLDQALETLLEQGRQSGSIRPDVDTTDVVLLLGALSRVPAQEWDTRAKTVVDVIVVGLERR